MLVLRRRGTYGRWTLHQTSTRKVTSISLPGLSSKHHDIQQTRWAKPHPHGQIAQMG